MKHKTLLNIPLFALCLSMFSIRVENEKARPSYASIAAKKLPNKSVKKTPTAKNTNKDNVLVKKPCKLAINNHIFTLNIVGDKNSTKVSGFHHDYNKKIENENKTRFTISSIPPEPKAGECYKTKIYDYEKLINIKSMFPSTCEVEQIKELIQKAYNKHEQAIKKSAQYDNRYELVSTVDNIKIKLIIDQHYKCITAYPLMNNSSK